MQSTLSCSHAELISVDVGIYFHCSTSPVGIPGMEGSIGWSYSFFQDFDPAIQEWYDANLVNACAASISWIGATGIGIGCKSLLHHSGIWQQTDVVIDCSIIGHRYAAMQGPARVPACLANRVAAVAAPAHAEC